MKSLVLLLLMILLLSENSISVDAKHRKKAKSAPPPSPPPPPPLVYVDDVANSNTFNVLSYGAKGDGVGDDTSVSLQARVYTYINT